MGVVVGVACFWVVLFLLGLRYDPRKRLHSYTPGF